MPHSDDKMAGIVLTGGLRPGDERAESPADHAHSRAAGEGGQLPGRVQGPQSHRQNAPGDAEKISLIRDIVAKNVNVKKIIECPVICPFHCSLNPALKDLPVYQPGRPIEEVARELGLPADDIIKLASNENPLGPSPPRSPRCKRRSPASIFIPTATRFT